MAVEAASNCGAGELAISKSLSYGIVERTLNIKDEQLAKRIGRPRGVYVTYDCPQNMADYDRAGRALEGYISHTLSRMLGTLKRSSPLLVVGLGNRRVTADALGPQVIDQVLATRHIREQLPDEWQGGRKDGHIKRKDFVLDIQQSGDGISVFRRIF